MFNEYLAHGWKLCRIEPGSKGPRSRGWNEPHNALKSADGVQAAGLMHAYSGTCAFDIDDLAKTAKYLQAHGIELSDLLLAPDAVQISSGRPNRGKLLYAMSQPLPSKSFAEGAFELRCGTTSGKTAQDVLPPSPHPSGTAYKWIGDWKKLPPIPEPLLVLWTTGLGSSSNADKPIRKLESSFVEIQDLLSRRDPSCGYKEWVDIGMAIHHATEGSADGLQIWDDWSAESETEYRGIEDLRSHWVSFHADVDNPITLDSLRKADSKAAADPSQFEEFSALLEPEENPYKGKFMSVPDLAKRPKPTWIIPGVLPEAGVGCIWGPSKAGKTFVAIDVAMAVATGAEWGGLPAKRGKVLYIAAEDDGGVQVRFEAIYANRGVVDAPISVLPMSPAFTSPQDNRWLTEAIDEFGKVSLIFVDTMAAVTPGADENSSKDMNLLIRFCKQLHKRTGALVILIHHANKTGTLRGSSALHAAFDVEWEVTFEEGMRTVWPVKIKNAPEGDARRFGLIPIDVFKKDKTENDFNTCVVKWLQDVPNKE